MRIEMKKMRRMKRVSLNLNHLKHNRLKSFKERL